MKEEKIEEKLAQIEEEEIVPLSKEEKNEKKKLDRYLNNPSTDLSKDKEESINDVYGEYLNNEYPTKREIVKAGKFI